MPRIPFKLKPIAAVHHLENVPIPSLGSVDRGKAPDAINPEGIEHRISAGAIPFHRLPPNDVALCVDIVRTRGIPVLRAANAQLPPPMQYPIDGMLYAMDIAAVHLFRPLDLQKLRHSEPVDFAHDFSAIIRLIDRNTGRLPDWIRLRCEVPRH